MRRFTRAAMTLAFTLGSTQVAHASPATDAFENLKALAGTWDVTNANGSVGLGTYEVVSDGSVVLEQVLGMMTTYYVDNDVLKAVHYCSAHNRPRFNATVQSTASNVTFEVVGVGGLSSPNDGYMAKLSLAFGKKDQFAQAWTWREDGVDSTPEVFTYKRHVAANN